MNILPLDVQREIMLYLTPEQQEQFCQHNQNLTFNNDNDYVWSLRLQHKFGFPGSLKVLYTILDEQSSKLDLVKIYAQYNLYEKFISCVSFKDIATPGTLLYQKYIESGTKDYVDFFLQEKIDLNACDKNRNTLLTLILGNMNNDTIAKMLPKILHYKPDLNILDNYGMTPLTIATCTIDITILFTLPINLQTRNTIGQTILMITVGLYMQYDILKTVVNYCPRSQILENIKTLLAAGVDTYTVDNNGRDIMAYEIDNSIRQLILDARSTRGPAGSAI